MLGFRSSTRFSPITASPQRDLKRRESTQTPSAAARVSRAIKPALCRVPWYFFPGFPSPTMISSTGPAGAAGLLPAAIFAKSSSRVLMVSSPFFRQNSKGAVNRQRAGRGRPLPCLYTQNYTDILR